MKIEFIYSKKADKFFYKHINIKEEFEKKLINYFKGNRNVDIKSLQGLNIGTYRIIFTRKNGDIIIIHTVDVGNRGDIYNNIKNIKKNLKF